MSDRLRSPLLLSRHTTRTMQAKTFVRCVETLWWTHLVVLIAAIVGAIAVVMSRLRSAPYYLNPIEFLGIAVFAESYVALASGVAWGLLKGDSSLRRLRFLLLALAGGLSAAAIGIAWSLLTDNSEPLPSAEIQRALEAET